MSASPYGIGDARRSPLAAGACRRRPAVTASHDQIAAQLARLQRLPAASRSGKRVPEHAMVGRAQRDRTRVFLTGELCRAREAGGVEPEDLDWVEREGDLLVEQAELSEAKGVACSPAGRWTCAK
jgi:hypothetical protein